MCTSSSKRGYYYFRQVKGKAGKLLARDSEILDKWCQHSGEISALKYPSVPHAPSTFGLVLSVAYKEVATALGKIKK